MSTTTNTLETFLKLNISDWDANLKSAGAELKNFTSESSNALGGLKQAFAGLAIGGGILEMVKSFADLEEETSRVAMVAGKTGVAFDDLKKKVQSISMELSENTVHSAMDVTAAFKGLADKGIDITNASVKNMLPLLNYAEASGNGLNETVSVAAKTFKQFGLTLDDSGKFTSLFSDAMGMGKQKLEDFSTVTQTLSSYIKPMNLGMNDLAVMTKYFSDQAIPAGKGAYALRQEITLLDRPTGLLKDVLSKLPPEFQNINVKTDGVIGALKKLSNAGVTADQAMRIFGGGRGGAGAVIAGLLGVDASGKKVIDTLLEMKGKIGDTGDGVAKAAEKIEGFNDKAAQLWHTVENLGTVIGGTMVKSLIEYNDKLKGVVQSVEEWIKQHPQLSEFIGKSVIDVGIYTAVLESLALAYKGVAGAAALMAANPITAGILALAVIIQREYELGEAIKQRNKIQIETDYNMFQSFNKISDKIIEVIHTNDKLTSSQMEQGVEITKNIAKAQQWWLSLSKEEQQLWQNEKAHRVLLQRYSDQLVAWEKGIQGANGQTKALKSVSDAQDKTSSSTKNLGLSYTDLNKQLKDIWSGKNNPRDAWRNANVEIEDFYEQAKTGKGNISELAKSVVDLSTDFKTAGMRAAGVQDIFSKGFKIAVDKMFVDETKKVVDDAFKIKQDAANADLSLQLSADEKIKAEMEKNGEDTKAIEQKIAQDKIAILEKNLTDELAARLKARAEERKQMEEFAKEKLKEIQKTFEDQAKEAEKARDKANEEAQKAYEKRKAENMDETENLKQLEKDKAKVLDNFNGSLKTAMEQQHNAQQQADKISKELLTNFDNSTKEMVNTYKKTIQEVNNQNAELYKTAHAAAADTDKIIKDATKQVDEWQKAFAAIDKNVLTNDEIMKTSTNNMILLMTKTTEQLNLLTQAVAANQSAMQQVSSGFASPGGTTVSVSGSNVGGSAYGATNQQAPAGYNPGGSASQSNPSTSGHSEPTYSLGTMFAPETTRALIHKGEIILDPDTSNRIRSIIGGALSPTKITDLIFKGNSNLSGREGSSSSSNYSSGTMAGGTGVNQEYDFGNLFQQRNLPDIIKPAIEDSFTSSSATSGISEVTAPIVEELKKQTGELSSTTKNPYWWKPGALPPSGDENKILTDYFNSRPKPEPVYPWEKSKTNPSTYETNKGNPITIVNKIDTGFISEAMNHGEVAGTIVNVIGRDVINKGMVKRTIGAMFGSNSTGGLR